MAKTTVYRPFAAREVSPGQASEAFRLRCQAQNLSAGTLVWYGENLKRWNRFLESKGVTLAREVTPDLIRRYIEDMRQRGNASGTVARTYGGLRCFFSFLSRERMIPQNPFQLVEKPRMEHKMLRPLSMDQARLLLANANKKRFSGQRLWTIILVILDTGLRVSELISIRTDQIDFHGGVIRVMGKGAKERQVPFGAAAKQALWSYLMRRGEIPGQDLLFVNQYGNRLCRFWIEKAIRNLGRAVNIQGVRVSPHTLRHTFATQYIKNGGDAFSLQKILGHSTLDMVRVYVGLADQEVTQQHRKFSPMDNIGIVPGGRKRVVVH